MGVLDLGFGSTLLKELAKTHKHISEKIYERDLLKTLEFFYWLLSILVMCILILMSNWISTNWLKIIELKPKDLSNILILMAISLGVQFPFSLYSSGLSGLQKQFNLNIIILIGNLFRHIIGVAMIIFFNNLVAFFIAQIFISIIITLTARVKLWKSLHSNYRPKINFKILTSVFKFSVGMALTTFVSVIMANADRVILSKMTIITNLGIYSLAFTATGLLQLVVQPFYRTYYPIYSEIVSVGNHIQIQREYFESTKIFSIFFFPISISALFFAPQIFYLWLGEVNPQMVLVFRFLILGLTFSGLSWLPVAFQQANEWSSLHFKIISIALIVGIPLSIIAINKFGVIGATLLCLLNGILDFTVGLWIMHKRLLIGKYFLWIKNSIATQFLVAFIILFICKFFMPIISSKFLIFLYISLSGVIALLLNIFLSRKF